MTLVDMDRQPKYTLKQAQPDDFEAVVIMRAMEVAEEARVELSAEVLQRTTLGIVEIWNDPSHTIWVCKEENKIIGQGMHTLTVDLATGDLTLDCYGLYVAPAYRGRGVANFIYAQALASAKERGVRVIRAIIDRDTSRDSLLRRLGGQETGVIVEVHL